MMQQRPQQQQQQLWRASQPSTAANGRRPVHSSPGVAIQQPLQALRPRTHGLKLRCRADQHAEESVVIADRQLDEGARSPTIPPPRGIVANNAVALWRRRRQQGRKPEDKNASSAAASAAEAAQASAKPGVDAGVHSVTVQQAQHPAAAQPQAEQVVDDAPGSVLGAVALVTGSSVGAGILALPSVAAPAGFGPSTAALGACWLLLAAQAMLLAEVNLGVTAIRAQEQAAAGQPAGRQMVTLRQMAGATLGRAGGAAASATYLLLSLSLLTAYIAKAGEMVGAGSPVDPTIAGAGFTAALGVMMCFGGASTADAVNRWLTGALMLVFGGILAFGAGHADASLLAATVDWRAAPPAIPIIFLSLVFHDLVPVVCAQLGGDRARVRTALLAGSLLPLAMFVSWDAIMLALTGEPGGAAPTDPLAVLIADSGGAVGWALQGFSLLALATSFIGTCTGLTSTLQSEYAAVTASAAEPDAGSQPRSPNVSRAAGDKLAEGTDAGSTADVEHSHPAPQSLVYLTALLPPLAVASAHPGSFLTLLSAAGGYGMSFLYGVMPPLMAWQLRSRLLPGSEASHWMPGGSGMLAALCASAVAVEVGQAAMSYGWL